VSWLEVCIVNGKANEQAILSGFLNWPLPGVWKAWERRIQSELCCLTLALKATMVLLFTVQTSDLGSHQFVWEVWSQW